MTAKPNDLKVKKQAATTTKKIIAAAVSKASAGSNGFSLISTEKLFSLYAVMLQCRMIEERMRARYPHSKAFSLGREAAAAGVTLDLLPEDALVPSYHDLIPAFVKGVPLKKLFTHLQGRATRPGVGATKSSDSTPALFAHAPLNVHASSSTIAAQLNIATDLALANKIKDNGKVVAVFSSVESGSTPGAWLGPWLEALRFAGEQSLPILFVSQNNLANDLANQRRSLASGRNTLDTQAFGYPSIPVDGNDVVAVYRVASESIARIRMGRGPTLINCLSYRLATSSAHTRTRKDTSDAILSMEKYLTGKGLFNDGFREQIVAAFSKEMDAVIAGSASRRT